MKDAIPGSISGEQFNDRFTAAVQKIYDSGNNKPVAFSHAESIMYWTLMNVKNPKEGLATSHPLPNLAAWSSLGSPAGVDVGRLGRYSRLQLLTEARRPSGTVLDSTASAGLGLGAVTQTVHHGAECPPWSPRETELLAVTLQLLQEHGYDRLTVDAVAAAARASKATVYRRWPSKAELVLAAFIEGVRQVAVHPETGTLRGDLLQLGHVIRQQACQQAEHHSRRAGRVSRHPALASDATLQFT